jgi:hypothetical protein
MMLFLLEECIWGTGKALEQKAEYKNDLRCTSHEEPSLPAAAAVPLLQQVYP